MEILSPALRKRREVRVFFSYQLFFQVSLTQNNPFANMAFLAGEGGFCHLSFMLHLQIIFCVLSEERLKFFLFLMSNQLLHHARKNFIFLINLICHFGQIVYLYLYMYALYIYTCVYITCVCVYII